MQVLQAWRSEEYRKAPEVKKQRILASLDRTTSTMAEDTFLPLHNTETSKKPKYDVRQP
jgi:hypothetical protein